MSVVLFAESNGLSRFRFCDLLVNRMELQRSLFLRRKAEIEIISSSTIGMQAGVHPLIAYLSEKMTNVVQSLLL